MQDDKEKRIKYLVGIDEAGRGPLAGPVAVAAAACVLRNSAAYISETFVGVRDSKKLTCRQREEWFGVVEAERAAGRFRYAVALVGAGIIDRRGITYAVRIAISRVLRKLQIGPGRCQVFLDGLLKAPHSYCFQKTIIKGDELEPIISIASILAKVRRDREMERLACRFPGYGFERHKGYGTKEHIENIAILGPSFIHRRGFIKKILLSQNSNVKAQNHNSNLKSKNSFKL